MIKADAEHVVAALWAGPPPRRPGPVPTIGRGHIVDTAINRADLGGLAAVSMRMVAQDLGVGTMSLYTHVPGREVLVALMADRVAGEVVPPVAGPGGWRHGVDDYTRGLWALHLQHGWLSELPPDEPPLGPRRLAVRVALVALLADGLGIEPHRAWRVAASIDLHLWSLAARHRVSAGGAQMARWRALMARDEVARLPHLAAVAGRMTDPQGTPDPDPAEAVSGELALLGDAIAATVAVEPPPSA